MSKSIDDLKAAFSGESQANQKYQGFAKVADKDGKAMVAKLFRAAALAEHVHAQNHLKAMDGIGATTENLQEAIGGEADEFESMYPGFIADAKAEGNDDAVETFDFAMRVEEIHHMLYSQAAEAVAADSDLPMDEIYVCQGCGNTVLSEAPDKCPICGAPKSWFKLVE